jgi:hypothetical protein
VAWSWSAALFGVLAVAPAVLVLLVDDVQTGVATAVGVVPAVVVGITPRRRGRVVGLVVGVLAGLSMLLGSVLAEVPVLAVLGIFVLAIGAALLAARSRAGVLALSIALPLVGIGLSYEPATAAGLAFVMSSGSLWAFLVSLLWPEHDAPSAPPPQAARPTLEYGVRLGLAGASAATIGFALDLDHVGWAVGAALLVMRPDLALLRLRGEGRLLSVAVGATAAAGMATLTDEPGWYALAALIALAGAAGTRGSHWYVTPAFTTFLALSLLLYSDPADAGDRFTERLAETAVGVALAAAFGILVPRLQARRTTASVPPASGRSPR